LNQTQRKVKVERKEASTEMEEGSDGDVENEEKQGKGEQGGRKKEGGGNGDTQEDSEDLG